MAKSKALTSKLDRGSGGQQVDGNESSTGSKINTEVHLQGESYLKAHHEEIAQVYTAHQKLITTGEDLSEALSTARRRLQDQIESEAYLSQHFDHIGHVRQQLSTIRSLVEKIAIEVKEVEHLLVEQTEEYMAKQNASYVTEQQHELERFEARILREKEGRTRQLLEERRQALTDAFNKDLKTYQTIISYQGPVELKQRACSTEETLETIDLALPSGAHLEAFYETEEECIEKEPTVDKTVAVSETRTSKRPEIELDKEEI